jgi:sortase (surface protein transpeptidase)
MTRQHRSSLAVLTLVAFSLALASFAVAGARALQGRPSTQLQRSLPVPSAEEVAHAAALPAGPARPRQMPRPVRVAIPAIGVSAPVIPLHLNRDRSLQVPKTVTQTGWFVGGPEPGEDGAAVIVGHVDSHRGPGVFYRLRALRRGDVIKVVLKNRSTLRFVVRGFREVPKRRFPTRLVFGRTKNPTLRLITCDGAFDRSTGHYVDNYVVFASLA